MAAVSEIYRRIIHHQQWRKHEESTQSDFELSARREAFGELPYQVMLDRLAQNQRNYLPQRKKPSPTPPAPQPAALP